MSNHFQKRNKFFYVIPELFPEWEYESRMAIGMNFGDFKALNAPVFRFKIKGKTYEIEREKALELGNKYKLPDGFLLPNLIPMEEFTTT